MAPSFDPAAVEADWYSWWDGTHNLFGTPRPKTVHEVGTKPYPASASNGSNSFAMVLPPPNITGALHIGHATMATIEVPLYCMTGPMIALTSDSAVAFGGLCRTC